MYNLPQAMKDIKNCKFNMKTDTFEECWQAVKRSVIKFIWPTINGKTGHQCDLTPLSLFTLVHFISKMIQCLPTSFRLVGKVMIIRLPYSHTSTLSCLCKICTKNPLCDKSSPEAHSHSLDQMDHQLFSSLLFPHCA